ncbi:MAG: roadblock/LC7 domain-containing protein [Deltaproteobacteria bacterium]|nr:roadblock/LC7 domain-containing protein [Deltaproteobacteria bacterium]
MTFQETLQEFADAVGAKGAAMLAWDGEAVASYAVGADTEMDLIGAHHSPVLDTIKEASSRHDPSAPVQTVFITSAKARLSISVIKDNYCLVASLERYTPMGKVIVESRKAVQRIEEEMG